MPPQLKLSDILNILSIGILLELVLWFFIISIDKYSVLCNSSETVYNLINKISASSIVSFVIILSFPFWRFVSSFVEYIMYSKRPTNLKFKTIRRFRIYFKSKKFITDLYRYLFFAYKRKDSVNMHAFISGIAKSEKSIDLVTKSNILSVLRIDLESSNMSDYSRVYYLIKSYVEIKVINFNELYSQRNNAVYNFHIRLALVFHIAFLELIALSFMSFLGTRVNFNLFVYLCLLALYLSRFFSKTSKTYISRERDLLISDFNAVCASNS